MVETTGWVMMISWSMMAIIIDGEKLSNVRISDGELMVIFE